MKIAFLGKGGSGKSTLATALVDRLHTSGFRVLAVDADHNMDLSYNLGANPSVFLGDDTDFIKEHVGSDRKKNFRDALGVARAKGIRFSLSPPDPFTARFSTALAENLRLMVAGPHTDKVRSGDYCSHSLAAPLKTYLPLLTLTEREAVVIDERAGTDPVATGILKGVDLAIIVKEPTAHSARVADQIASELDKADIRYLIVENKITDIKTDSARAIERIEATL